MALWLGGFSGPGGDLGLMWIIGGICSLAACFYASYVVSRNAEEYARGLEMLNGRRKRRADLGRRMEETRAHIRDIENEQREVLALYGMAKGLSEALSWEDIRPRLEAAVEQYLGVESFAFYVADRKEQDSLEPLVRRKLGKSPASSWHTLARALQTQGLPLRVPNILSEPEPAVGLPIFESTEAVDGIDAGDRVSVDMEGGVLRNETKGTEYRFAPVPPFMRELLAAGGLLNYIAKRKKGT